MTTDIELLSKKAGRQAALAEAGLADLPREADPAGRIEWVRLRPFFTGDDIREMCDEALLRGYRCISLPLPWAAEAASLLHSAPVRVSTAVSFPCHLFDQLLKPVTCQFPEASIVINQQKQQWQKLIMALSVLPVVHPGQFLFSCQEQLLRMIEKTLHIFCILQNSKTPWHILKAAERKVIHRYQKETGLSGWLYGKLV